MRLRRFTITLKQQLMLLSALCAMVLLLVGQSAWSGLWRINASTERLRHIADATRLFLHADMMHDAVRGDVLAIVAGLDDRGNLASHSQEMRSDLDAASRAWWLAHPEDPFPDVSPLVAPYLTEAETIARMYPVAPDAALARLPAFQEQWYHLERSMDAVARNQLEAANEAAAATASEERRTTASALLRFALLAALALAGLLSLFGHQLVSRLRELGGVARAMSHGDLHRRNENLRDDELGELGHAFNAMADSLGSILSRLEADAERTAFTSQLGEALELADSRSAAADVLERALLAIAPDHPVELLLADSSQAHLERAAVHPVRGAPGCGVDSPWNCVAVRRASMMVYADSGALNACARLRDRPEGPCAAVCAPVTFMGRSLGVLHLASEPGMLPHDEVIGRLRVLALQAGARLGTISMMEKTQLQATTDGLTGLLNRRTVEDRAHRLVKARRPFALVIADLDHFKRLNDTHGHDAGDLALRRFAEVLRASGRGDDVAGRFGGEEFVLILPDTDAPGAVIVCERIRATLHTPGTWGGAPSVTASFGVTEVAPGGDFGLAYKRADVALYRAKESGRDRAVVATSEESVVRVSESPYGPAANSLTGPDEDREAG